MTLTPRSQIIDTSYIDIRRLMTTHNITHNFNITNNLDKLFFIRKYKNMTNNLEVLHYGIDYTNMINDEYNIFEEDYNFMMYLMLCEIINLYFNNDQQRFLMIDFFYTEKDKKNNKYKNDYHTTTLYKHTNENEIRLIDPNNSDFSEQYKIIINNLDKKYKIFAQNQIIFECVRGQIYNGYNDVDCVKNNKNTYLKSDYDNNTFLIRDCTNISLITCYELYELIQDSQKTSADIIDGIKNSISNQKRLNKNIGENLNGTLLSCLHSSDKMKEPIHYQY
jgi:hypothetical protein